MPEQSEELAKSPAPILIPVAPRHGSHSRGFAHPRDIWERLIHLLDHRKPNWRERVREISVDHIRAEREEGKVFNDAEVFEALALSLLSSNVDWDRVQAAKGKLTTILCGYDPVMFSKLRPEEIDLCHIGLREIGVGSQNLRRMLHYLAETVANLIELATPHGSIDGYLRSLFASADHNPERLAFALGTSGKAKLKGFGIPLAAEALRNLGYDLAKPDRHILRAFGAWGFVEFSRWDRSGNRAPNANAAKYLETMEAVRSFTRRAGLPSISLTDTTIWYACARTPGGGQLSNEDLVKIAREA